MKALVSRGNRGTVGAVGTRATRSAPSCYCPEHNRSDSHSDQASQPRIQGNSGMGTDVHEEERPGHKG